MTSLFRAFHITDAHFNPLGKRPQGRSLSYHDDTRWEFEQFTAVVRQERPDCILFSGDWMHIKNQDAYGATDILYLRELIKAAGVPVYSIPGNHDLPKSSFAQVEQTAYTNLIHSTPNLHDLAFRFVSLQGVHIYGVPYLPLDQLFARLPEIDAFFATLTGVKIILLHPDALPRDDLPVHYQTCSWLDLLNALPHCHVLCLGHIHQSFPVLQHAGPYGPQFVSKPWSFGRVVKDYFATTAVLEHQHRPMYADLKIVLTDAGAPQSISIEYCPLPFIPFEQAFVRETLRKELENAGKISALVSALRTESGAFLPAFQVTDPAAYLAAQTMPQAVRDVIQHYLNL